MDNTHHAMGWKIIICVIWAGNAQHSPPSTSLGRHGFAMRRAPDPSFSEHQGHDGGMLRDGYPAKIAAEGTACGAGRQP